MLATSRERLNVSREQEYPVPTLPPTEAVALFPQRARQLSPDFEPDEHAPRSRAGSTGCRWRSSSQPRG